MTEERIQYLIDSDICETAQFSSGIDGKIKGTDIYFSIDFRGEVEWWSNTTGESFKTFEEVLDNLDPVSQTELLFHLDLFVGHDV